MAWNDWAAVAVSRSVGPEEVLGPPEGCAFGVPLEIVFEVHINNAKAVVEALTPLQEKNERR